MLVPPTRLDPFIRSHGLALLCALLAGAISVAPYLLAVLSIGSAYQGIPFLFQANEDYYLARIREIFDGHGFIASPLFYEYKNYLPLIPPFGEYVYVPLALLGLSLPHTLVLAKFLFPVFLFLLVYFLTLELLKNHAASLARWSGIAAGTLIVVGIGLTDYRDVLLRLQDGISGPVLSLWTRPVNPITGALFLFLFLLMLVRVQASSYRFALFSGIVLALMAGYVFSFGVACAIVAVLGLCSLWFRDVVFFKKLLTVGGASLIILGTYALIVFPSLGEGTLARSGLLVGHMPLINKITLLAIVFVCGLLFYARLIYGVCIVRDWQRHLPLWFTLAFLLGSIVALNQQVLTGITIWPYHLVQYTVPLAILSVVIAGTILFGVYFPRVWKTFLSGSMILSAIFGIWNAGSYVTAHGTFTTMQQYAPIFLWFETNAEKDCVVLTVEDERLQFTNLIPGFTHCNIYHALHISGNVPKERIEHMYFVQLRLRGVKAEEGLTYFASHKDEVLARYHRDWHELFSSVEGNQRITNLIPEIHMRYLDFLKKDFLSEIKKYRADYLADTGILDSLIVQELGLEKVLDYKGISVYSF